MSVGLNNILQTYKIVIVIDIVISSQLRCIY